MRGVIFTPILTLHLSGNARPVGTDAGIWERLALIKFPGTADGSSVPPVKNSIAELDVVGKDEQLFLRGHDRSSDEGDR